MLTTAPEVDTTPAPPATASRHLIFSSPTFTDRGKNSGIRKKSIPNFGKNEQFSENRKEDAEFFFRISEKCLTFSELRKEK